MSYRSIKRVFGETKLELKLLMLFGIGLLLVIVTSFWWYGTLTVNLVYEQNQTTGRLLVDKYMVTLHWEAMDPERSRRDPAWMPLSPEVERKQRQKSEDFVKNMTRTFSNDLSPVELILPDRKEGPQAPRDEFERQVCEEFLKSPPDMNVGRGRVLPDSDKYVYLEPIRAKDSCLLTCHASPLGGSGIDLTGSGVPLTGPPSSAGRPGLSKGDIMGIARVTIPNEAVQRKQIWNWAILWATAILTVFLAMITSYAIVRYVIVKPLRHLRDVSDAISRGNVTLRAEIHTGDEFEELSTAFNRMLRHLVTIQDELRQANINLDSKVDELAQVNMRLYELNMIKSDFLATMSHELRTPLNSILGFSEVLGSIDSLDDKQKRYVQNIQKSGRTLLDMINDVLDLAKMESGKMDVRLADFRMAQVVGAQCDMARPLAEKKNIDLELSVEPDLPPMRQDQARVQQILNNLLSNAIKFTPEGGRITVSVGRDEADFLVLQVADTGVGIAEEDQQAIFEKFRQGRTAMPSGDAMTREYSGSGLGLSIVKELCKLLGGEVSVQSELGKGSTFTVRLPRTVQEQPRLDAALVEGFEEFTKQRFDLSREHSQ